jgi:hypothetical protein
MAGALRYPLYWLSWPLAYYAAPDLAETCGEDVGDIARIPIEAYQQIVQAPTDEQRAALQELANDATTAAQDIKAACPADLALTAPGRLAAMQRRIEAMIAAADALQPALEKFYGLLSDEQKARLNLLAGGQPQNPDEPPGPLAQNCDAAQLGETGLPTAQIDGAIHPSDAQHAKLVALQNASTQAAADLLKASCVAETPLTPPARLAAIRKRLAAMLEAVKLVSAAMADFYGTLSDEQKARFEAIGPLVASQDDAQDAAPEEDAPEEVAHTPVRRRGPPPIGQFIRHFVPF